MNKFALGIQTRTLYCIESATGQRVSEEMCDNHNVTKPLAEKPCETVDCEPQ